MSCRERGEGRTGEDGVVSFLGGGKGVSGDESKDSASLELKQLRKRRKTAG